MSSSEAPPSEIYHYTSAVGALGMLSTGKIRASMMHYMNDAQELRYSLNLGREIIASGQELTRADDESIWEEFVQVIKFVAVFVFSFTTEADDLSQWRAYCPQGGYALAFDTAALSLITKDSGFTLSRCEYDLTAQRATLEPIIREMLVAARDFPVGAGGMALYKTFAERFLRLGACMKHPSFAAEREWRLIAGPGMDPSKVEYRVSGSLIVPYFELSVANESRRAISSITVSPMHDSDLAARSIKYLTHAKLGWPLHVKHASSPLRPRA